MGESNDRYTQTAKELTRKTNNGEINWQAFDPSEEATGSTVAEEGYKTKYKGRELKLYRQLEERDLTETEKMLSPDLTIAGTGNPETKTIEKTTLKIRDPDTGGEWTFPNLSILSDLHSAVQQSSAGVQQWMDKVLEDQ
ncbi:hypothetical protein GGP72_003322 [Salinibacter ruber]|uniref:Uncharacterized protein n=1 Tax=Salinibacter ruber TaxID=146919 RepID=A0A9X2TFS8_9BACT|nr:hypothetical protein [Salinibacter ruber]MCS3679364.1 hypothetical protein [Salinibacter ruber]MCS3682658.1 hypothetical protein [Salinibacter ruber]